jgi:hypothetical protein
MADDRHGRSAGPLLGCVEPAAARRPESQDIEICRRRELDGAVTNGAVVEVSRGVRNTGGHRCRKDVGVLRHLQVDGVRRDDERPAEAIVLIDVDQAIGSGERLPAKQHRIDDAEDRGGGADGEAQDQDRRCRESPIAREAAERVARVARQRVEGGCSARVAAHHRVCSRGFTWGEYVGRVAKVRGDHRDNRLPGPGAAGHARDDLPEVQIEAMGCARGRVREADRLRA